MPTRFFKTVTLLALTALSSAALAQDPPSRVGRVSLSQGPVTVGSEAGDETGNLVNWPLTSHNRITTGRGARTEFRVGSSAVRLDGDSSLEITELDDDSFRLRLNYGSASVRIRNAEVARDFELATPQGVVRMREPGRIRVDAERRQDTSVVNVFDGVALVEAGGAQLTVRAGKRAEIQDDDVRTALVASDSFDDWARQRDMADERAASARYVTSEMTGYEELDRNGTWREDAEYGPLWLPRSVGAGWVPYRDGRWTWVAPWGWTWVDDAPWGYAPSHYGRWVYVNQRWAWAPGRNLSQLVWAPALVGWVGGSGWNLNFGSHGARHPALGWYPLSPRERFVPAYRLSHDRLEHINRHARPDGQHGRRDHRRDGLTVVPHAQFGHRGTVVVPGAPKAIVPPQVLQNAPSGAPPAPQLARRFDRDGDGRADQRFDRDGDGRVDRRVDRDGDGRAERRIDRDGDGRVDRRFDRDGDGRADRRDRRDDGQRWRGHAPQPTVIPVPPTMAQPVPPVVGQPPPTMAGQPVTIFPQPAPPGPSGHRDGRSRFDGERRYRNTPEAPPIPAPPAAAAPVPVQPHAVAQPVQPRPERQFRGDNRELRMREPDARNEMLTTRPQPPVAVQPPPPQAPPRMAPPPPPAPPPAPAAAPMRTTLPPPVPLVVPSPSVAPTHGTVPAREARRDPTPDQHKRRGQQDER